MKNGVKAIFYFLLFLGIPAWSSEQASSSSMEDIPTSGQKRKLVPTETEQIEKKTKKEASAEENCTVGIIGATGNVGLTTSTGFTIANNLTKRFTGKTLFSKLLLWGSEKEESKIKCRGEAYDLSDSKTEIEAVETLADIAPSDIIIITAGIAQKPKQTRDELFETNKDIIRKIITELHSSPKKNKNAILVMVTNPVEDLAQVAYMASKKLEYLNNPDKQIIGSGTILDTNRLHNSIRDVCNVPLEEINAYAFGEHGELVFVPWSQAKINDTQLTEDQKKKTVEETRKRVYEILNLKGYTQHGIANCLVDIFFEICQTIKNGGSLPVSVYHPEYQVYLSLLTKLGKSGVEGIVDFPLNDEESGKLNACIEKRSTIKKQLEDEYEGTSSSS